MKEAQALQRELKSHLQVTANPVTPKRRRQTALGMAQAAATERMALSTEPAYPEAMMELQQMIRG